ncbi:uncharacterized protein B0I36DRAFT_318948 [Microdochium trichocladiopsis]|uniref:Uncharacterized protein n=1 Tax=Microdochium trichocladiopsis TaxID=1682393 RepID=A0A9P9BTQ3_9PEZI|nr:uncharacterized protein B0I36DRAFT_318948 [Microdochium trichocladiopsis]KAH7035717.1 hypothetical protein B0I36DRAFT_318948 [Microdochium trichocladiopsis]
MLLGPTTSERSDITSRLLRSSQQPESFVTYFQHYEYAICGPLGQGRAFRSHEEIIQAAASLCNNPVMSRADFEALTFAGRVVSPQDRERATGGLTAVALMVVSDSKDYYSTIFRGTVKWEPQEPFLTFLQNLFSTGPSTTAGQPGGIHTIYDQKKLKLWKLHSRFDLEIVGTNDIFEHLKLDPMARTLKIFHQVAFLRAQLRLADGLPLEMNFEESLKRGCLPPQLVFETLVLNQLILLPVLTDRRSNNLLEKLIRRNGFDPTMRDYDIVRQIPPDFVFSVWAARLDELHDFIKRPPPGNSIVAWFERHTSERNALTVAILGLFLTVVIGIFGLVVAVLQLVLAWYAYKYPIADS